ncbi:MAG: metal-dependent hydrolase [Pseudomonadota bacterium]
MIKVRKIKFEFPDDIPFYFNPLNREASVLANTLSFLAPAFERFFIRGIRAAMPKVSSAAVREEADLFCKQEGQHSKIHIDHQNMLLRKYPSLESARDRVNASYAHLLESEPNAYALAYATNIELAFKPMARYLVENRHHLFGDGDPRISSFILWHFVEEFEHRSAMFNVYQDVVGDYLFRMKTVKRTRQHVSKLGGEVLAAMAACEPLPETTAEGSISRWSRLKLALGLLETSSPFHNPESGGEPKWITDWLRAEESGDDMRIIRL